MLDCPHFVPSSSFTFPPIFCCFGWWLCWCGFCLPVKYCWPFSISCHWLHPNRFWLRSFLLWSPVSCRHHDGEGEGMGPCSKSFPVFCCLALLIHCIHCKWHAYTVMNDSCLRRVRWHLFPREESVHESAFLQSPAPNNSTK